MVQGVLSSDFFLLTILEPYNGIRTALDVHGVNETHSLGAFGRHDYRRSPNAGSKEAHSAKYRPIRHTGCRENDFLAGREIVRIVDAVRITDPHLLHSIHRVFTNSVPVFRLLSRVFEPNARASLSVQTLHRRRGKHAFGSAAGTHRRMNSGSRYGGRDASREVSVRNELDASAGLPDVSDQLLVP